MNVLVFNAGSASLKFDVVEASGFDASADDGKKLLSGSVEGIGRNPELTLYEGKAPYARRPLSAPDYAAAAGAIARWLLGEDRLENAAALPELGAVAHRIVHGADRFADPVRIDADVLDGIESLAGFAPLHNRSAAAVIRAAARLFGGLPAVAVFDTAFHRDLPELARAYGIPRDLAARHRLRRYGFHGISHRYLARRYATMVGAAFDAVTLITLHLEGGSSASAVSRGRCVDTSMGLTPLEGLMMGTRSGDVDPGLVLYLAQLEKQGEIESAERLLNEESGLLGLSAVSADTRVLMRHFEDARVRFALDVFSYRLKKYLGAYLAVLGGADAIVFGGGIGENTPYVRAAACAGLEFCGLRIDEAKNAATIDISGRISSDDSRLHAFVIVTDEALQIAHEAAALLESRPS